MTLVATMMSWENAVVSAHPVALNVDERVCVIMMTSSVVCKSGAKLPNKTAELPGVGSSVAMMLVATMMSRENDVVLAEPVALNGDEMDCVVMTPSVVYTSGAKLPNKTAALSSLVRSVGSETDQVVWLTAGWYVCGSVDDDKDDVDDVYDVESRPATEASAVSRVFVRNIKIVRSDNYCNLSLSDHGDK